MRKKVNIGLFLILLSAITINFQGELRAASSDAESMTTIYGKLSDINSGDPVVFATISVKGTSIGTVSNSDGEFILKVPPTLKNSSIEIVYLGFKNKEYAIADFSANDVEEIKMERNTIPIDEVVIQNIDPLDLLEKVRQNIDKNYSGNPEMQTGFYRETIKQNRNYVSISEAVLDIYKAAYYGTTEADRVDIYKGRKSRDVKKMDTVLLKLAGGPHTSAMLDIVQSPGDILEREMLSYYKFTLGGLTTINDRETYILEFNQLQSIDYPLYDGILYVDKETYAIAGINFEISEHGLKYASGVLVRRKPLAMRIDITGGNYLINYRILDGKWYLKYVRSELTIKSKWKRKLFSSNYTTMLEMAVTDRDAENVKKISNKEAAKTYDILAEQVSTFQDDNFWGDYNFIKPDESIEVAIEKLNKKLIKRSE